MRHVPGCRCQWCLLEEDRAARAMRLRLSWLLCGCLGLLMWLWVADLAVTQWASAQDPGFNLPTYMKDVRGYEIRLVQGDQGMVCLRDGEGPERCMPILE